MAGFGVLNVAVSGLTAANRALETIGHNIANVNTEGYSRQRVDIVARPPQLGGGSYLGTGVDVASTRRLYDGFATAQVRVSSSSAGYADTYYGLAQGLDNLLADPDTGLTTPLQSFFDATHDLANDPASPAARTVLLTEAEGLAARFRTLDQALADLDRRLNQSLSDAIAEVNSLSQAIADVNHDILVAKGGAEGAQPNDLLDQRDELLRRLSAKISIAVVEQDDGTINVAAGSGQSLVAGTRSAALVALPGSYDPTRLEVGYRSGNQTANINSLVSGGELGALVQFRAQVLDPARNAMGRVAIGLAQTFNEQHAAGLTLDGSAGGSFFLGLDQPSTQSALRHSANGVPPAGLAVAVTDAGRLGTSDYELVFDGSEYTVRRVSDGTEVYAGAAFPVTLASEGLALSLAGASPIQAGDRFLIRPSRRGAGDFGLALTDPDAIAAAGAAGGAGNNENALKLAALRTEQVLDQGTATYEDAYGSLVVAVGTKTRQAEVNQAAQQTLLDEATRVRESAAGVNLDEEAADLMRFQQHYQASAQVVATANLLFDALLQAVGR